MNDWLGFQVTAHALFDGVGVVPQGVRAPLPPADALLRRRRPDLGEENVRDLLLSNPDLLADILGAELRLVVRELHRVDLVAFEAQGPRAHLIELKHHAKLRPNHVAMVQIARHVGKVAAGIRRVVPAHERHDASVTPWVLTSRVEARRGDVGEGAPKVLQFAEVSYKNETWLAFRPARAMSELCLQDQPRAVPLLTESEHVDLAANLKGAARGVATLTTSEFAEGRRTWVLNLLGHAATKDSYVTIDLQPLIGGPFVTLTCSAKIADAVAYARMFGPPHDPLATAYIDACRAASRVGDGWHGPVECDDQLLRNCWAWTGPSATTAAERAKKGLELVHHLANEFTDGLGRSRRGR